MNSLDELILQIQELEEVKSFKRIEDIIDNLSYSNKLKELFEIQKLMINAKHYELDNDYYEYLKQYNEIKKDIEEDVLINTYLEKLEEVNLIISNITNIISNEIESKLNK